MEKIKSILTITSPWGKMGEEDNPQLINTLLVLIYIFLPMQVGIPSCSLVMHPHLALSPPPEGNYD